MVRSFMCWCSKWDTLDDGDDVLVVIEQSDLEHLRSTVEDGFRHFGMVVKVEGVANVLSDVTFCQSKVIEYAPGRVKFVRDFRAIFSKSLCGVRNFSNNTYRRRVLHAIGECELVLGLGVPILQSFACCVLRNTAGAGGGLRYAPDGLQARAARDRRSLPSSVGPRVIHECARLSFCQAFGVSPSEQCRLEAMLDELDFVVDGQMKVFETAFEAVWSHDPPGCETYRL